MAEHRYSRVEFERRFVVASMADWRAAVEPHPKTIVDAYVRGTRLRLRAIETSATGARELKLTKKEASDSPYYRTISRILLSERELALLSTLGADRLTKVRHHVVHDGRRWAVDVFAGELDRLALCEVEAESLAELGSLTAPAWAGCEVTEDSFFDGANLARTSRDALLAKLAALRAC